MYLNLTQCCGHFLISALLFVELLTDSFVQVIGKHDTMNRNLCVVLFLLISRVEGSTPTQFFSCLNYVLETCVSSGLLFSAE